MGVLQDCFLAIESAVRGGSVALFSNGKLVASRVGDGDRSRSEDLLPGIAEMLNEAGVAAARLDRVIVSRGPGSFTGIRIGVATAMGLGDSLGIPVLGASLFEVFAGSIDEQRNAMVVVPIGRNDLAWQRFEYGTPAADIGNIGPQAGTVDQFLVSVRESEVVNVHCHSSISESLRRRLDEGVTTVEIGPNLAEIVGNSILRGERFSFSLEPIYVANATHRA